MKKKPAFGASDSTRVRTRTFVCKNDKSDKFWNVSWVEGTNRFRVNYGKRGTLGSTKEYLCASPSDMLAKLQKKILEKFNKGYTETTGGNTLTLITEKPVPASDPSPLDIL